MPVSDGFDYPLGAPDAKGYCVTDCYGLGFLEQWDYQGDGIKEYHPGEDWNDDNSGDDYGGNSEDANDPVYAISDGLILYAKYSDAPWGYLVFIEHKLDNGSTYWSLYAHMSSISPEFINRKNVLVKRGEIIGRVGDYPHGSNSSYHLHFELRKKYQKPTAFVMNWSKEKVQEYYVEPSAFIKANRPVPPPVPQKLAVTTESQNEATLSWDEAARDDFNRYDLYRAEAEGDTLDGDKRELVTTVSEKASLSYTDKKLYSGTNYYYRIFTYYKNGQVATSNEVQISFERQSINLTNQAGVQRYVGISDGRVYWENNVRDQTSFPQRKTFYYYDLDSKSLGSLPIGDSLNKIDGPYRPQVGDKWLCYTGKRSTYGNYDIYCKDLTSEDLANDIQITEYGGNDEYSAISDDGILVWQGYDEEQENRRIKWTDLYKVDVFGNFEIQYLTDTPGAQYSPRVWGQKVIFTNQLSSTSQKELRYRDITTGEEGIIATDIDNSSIDIWGDNVIYCKGHKLVWAKISDVEFKKEIAADGLNARMRDGRIVYAQLGTDNKYYVRVYMMATEKTVTVAGPLKFQPSPYVYENMVAYDASPIDSSTDMDIYLTWL